MPGPKSTPAKGFKFPVGKPNKRAAARLAARQADYEQMLKQGKASPGAYTKPGSQNRNK